MGIDKDFQYNGHNSYVLAANEKYKSMPFFVQNMQHITHSFFAMAPTVLASATRLKTLFFDASGLYLSEETHAFAVDVLWSREEITLTVPSGAHLAQLEFLGGASGWRFSEPKSEEGQTATPYNINYQGQLSKMTPTGVYTGFLHARNILLSGTQAEPGDRLDTELVKISNKQIVLENTVAQKTTRITSDGVYTGLISADQIVGGAIRATNGITFGPFTQADYNEVVQLFVDGASPTHAQLIKFDLSLDGTISALDRTMISRMVNGLEPPTLTVYPTIRIEPRTPTFEGGIFFGSDEDVDSATSNFYMSSGVFKGRHLETRTAEISTLTANRIERGLSAIQLNQNQLTAAIDGAWRLFCGSSDAYLTVAGNQIGVDNGGAYKIVNGTKTYL